MHAVVLCHVFPHVISPLCFLHTRRYALPHVAFEAKYMLRCCPQKLAVNSDSTRMSIIDINGVVSLYVAWLTSCTQLGKLSWHNGTLHHCRCGRRNVSISRSTCGNTPTHMQNR